VERDRMKRYVEYRVNIARFFQLRGPYGIDYGILLYRGRYQRFVYPYAVASAGLGHAAQGLGEDHFYLPAAGFFIELHRLRNLTGVHTGRNLRREAGLLDKPDEPFELGFAKEPHADCYLALGDHAYGHGLT